MFYKNKYRIKSSGDMDKDLFLKATDPHHCQEYNYVTDKSTTTTVGENIIATTKIRNNYGAISQYWTFLY